MAHRFRNSTPARPPNETTNAHLAGYPHEDVAQSLLESRYPTSLLSKSYEKNTPPYGFLDTIANEEGIPHPGLYRHT